MQVIWALVEELILSAIGNAATFHKKSLSISFSRISISASISNRNQKRWNQTSELHVIFFRFSLLLRRRRCRLREIDRRAGSGVHLYPVSSSPYHTRCQEPKTQGLRLLQVFVSRSCARTSCSG
jgi:hypothetical protein